MKFSKIFIGKNNGQSFKQASLLLCSAVLTSGVYAADGQITFAGSVYAPTCSVTSKTLNVTLEKKFQIVH